MNAGYTEDGVPRQLRLPDKGTEVQVMKALTSRTMIPRRGMNAAMKTLMSKKNRMMKNHNVHVITHHGKVMVGRKGRKS